MPSVSNNGLPGGPTATSDATGAYRRPRVLGTRSSDQGPTGGEPDETRLRQAQPENNSAASLSSNAGISGNQDAWPPLGNPVSSSNTQDSHAPSPAAAAGGVIQDSPPPGQPQGMPVHAGMAAMGNSVIQLSMEQFNELVRLANSSSHSFSSSASPSSAYSAPAPAPAPTTTATHLPLLTDAARPLHVVLPPPPETLPPNMQAILDKHVTLRRNRHFSTVGANAKLSKLEQLLSGFPDDPTVPIGKDYPINVREVKGKAWKEGDPIRGAPWQLATNTHGRDEALEAVHDRLQDLQTAVDARHRVEMKLRLTDITQAHRLVAEASASLFDATASATALQHELLSFLGGDPSASMASQPALSALQLSRVQQALDEFPAAVTTAVEVLDDSKRKKRSDAATTELNRNKAELNLLRKDEQNVKTLVNTLVATNSAADSTAMGESEQEELVRLRQQAKEFKALKASLKPAATAVEKNKQATASPRAAAPNTTRGKPPPTATAADKGRGGRARRGNGRAKRGGGRGGS